MWRMSLQALASSMVYLHVMFSCNLLNWNLSSLSLAYLRSSAKLSTYVYIYIYILVLLCIYSFFVARFYYIYYQRAFLGGISKCRSRLWGIHTVATRPHHVTPFWSPSASSCHKSHTVNDCVWESGESCGGGTTKLLLAGHNIILYTKFSEDPWYG